MPFKIFISYSTQDLDKANLVKQRFDSYAALGVQTYLAEYDAPPGVKLSENLQKNLRESDVFCLLWSHNAKASDWVSQEIGIATATNKLVIPIVLDRDLHPPGFIQDRKYIAAYESFDSAMASLQKIILLHATTKKLEESKKSDALVLLGLGAVLLLVLTSND